MDKINGLPLPIFCLSLTLLHFIWQGFLLAGVVGIALRLTRRSNARLRYNVACVGLWIMTACPIVTYRYLSNTAIPDSSFEQVRSIPDAQFVTTSSHVTEISTTAGGDSSRVEGFQNNSLSLKQTGLSAVLIGWFLGVLFMSIRLMRGLVSVRELRSRSRNNELTDLDGVVDSIKQKLGLRGNISILISDAIHSTAVIGVFKKCLIIPASVLMQMPADQLEALLAHEIAHLKRNDYLTNLVQTMVETVLFYHPAIWWVSNQVRTEREYCCDDLAIWVTGDPLIYARSLTNMEEIRMNSLALAASTAPLISRIERIIGRDEQHSASSTLSLRLVAATLSLVTLCTVSFGLRPTPKLVPTPSLDGTKVISTKETKDHGKQLPTSSAREALLQKKLAQSQLQIRQLEKKLSVALAASRRTPVGIIISSAAPAARFTDRHDSLAILSQRDPAMERVNTSSLLAQKQAMEAKQRQLELEMNSNVDILRAKRAAEFTDRDSVQNQQHTLAKIEQVMAEIRVRMMQLEKENAELRMRRSQPLSLPVPDATPHAGATLDPLVPSVSLPARVTPHGIRGGLTESHVVARDALPPARTNAPIALPGTALDPFVTAPAGADVRPGGIPASREKPSTPAKGADTVPPKPDAPAPTTGKKVAILGDLPILGRLFTIVKPTP